MSTITRVPTPSVDHRVHQLLSFPLGAHSSDQQYMQVFVTSHTHTLQGLLSNLRLLLTVQPSIFRFFLSLSVVFSKRISQATFCHCCPVRLLSMSCRGQKTKAKLSSA